MAAAVNIAINNRFRLRAHSGVDRVAHETTRELQIIAQEVRGQIEITDEFPRLADGTSAAFWSRSFLRGHPWEQIELPLRTADKWLYSPCNTGPVVKRKQIVTIHDAQVFTNPSAYSRTFRTWYKLMLPNLAHRASIVTTVSDYSRRELEKLGVVPRNKVAVIPNGSDHIDRIEQDPLALKKFSLVSKKYFLALGSISPHKNLAMLIEAAASRKNQHIEIVIAGGMNSRIFAESAPVNAPGIRFLGRVTDNELKTLYSHALALAFPSLTEGFGLPPLEAMRCGCPVIASTGGAIPEACGNAALYADPHNVADWIRGLDRMEQDTMFRSTLISEGYEQTKKFTWRAAAIKLLELIANIETQSHLQSELRNIRA